MAAAPGTATLPDDLVMLLRAALAAEQSARGSQRRVQNRLCRALLGAASQLGYSLRDIADAIGRSWYTLRDRAHGCEPLSAVEFATLAGVPTSTVEEWLSSCAHDLDDGEAHGTDVPARRLLHVYLEHATDRAALSAAA